MLKQLPPYKINGTIDRYARKIWFSPRQWFPSVVLKATADVKNLRETCKTRGVSINAAIVKALAIALTDFPRLNYYALHGNLTWGGDKTSISVVAEEKSFEECRQVTILDAENKTLEEIQNEILNELKNGPRKPTFFQTLMNMFPKTAFLFRRLTGNVIDRTGVIVLTNINNPEIDEMIGAGIYYTMAICPGTINDDKMPLNLSFNHELANARPVAAFLAQVKKGLEEANL